MEKYTTFYANGCSHTAGGGLDCGLTNRSNEPFVYDKLYGIKRWKYEKDVTYPRIVADHLNLRLVNDAASGSGAPRLIRTTNEYIRKTGIKKLKTQILFLQINDPIRRIEMYCRDIDDYVIVNVEWNNYKAEDVSVVENYSIVSRRFHPDFFKGRIENDIINNLNNYFDPMKYQIEVSSNLLNLFSFLQHNEIQYFYCLSDPGLIYNDDMEDLFRNDEILYRNIEIDGCRDVSDYAHKHKLTVRFETNGVHGDDHAGYFGNKQYGELLAKQIEEKLNNL